MLRFTGLTLAVLSSFALVACQKSPPTEAASSRPSAAAPAQVDDKRLLAIDCRAGRLVDRRP